MTVAMWVTIGVAGFSQIFAVVWWLVRRPVARLDRLEGAVFGESGVNMRLTKYVSTEVFDKRMSTVDANMRGISEEGQRREDRIIQAIKDVTLTVGSDVGEIKNDMSRQSERIDKIFMMTGRTDR